jgi:archaetidylinositol phosphate synthase
LWSIGLTFLRMTLNTIDGVIAIERGNMRLKGEIVNALPDRYSDIFVLAGIALSPFCSAVLGIIGISSMFLVSYTGMLGKAIGCEWQHHGPLGKVERLVIIMIFSLLQYLNLTGKISAINNFSYFEVCMVVFLVLGQITVFNRLKGQLRQAEKLDWEKYRDLNKKIVVIYDSLTGNTKKVAEKIAEALSSSCITPEDAKSLNLDSFDLVVLATPNLGRKITTPAMHELLDNNPHIKNYALAITSGMPVYRLISGTRCIKYFTGKLNKKPITTTNIRGYHSIAKTYANRPNENDLLDSYLFGMNLARRIENV